MPPYAGAKTKGKGRDGRRSRSRNTTPSSVISAATAPASSKTPYTDVDSSILLPLSPSRYTEIVEQLESKVANFDNKQYKEIIDELAGLAQRADARSDLCSLAIRRLHDKKADIEAEEMHQREREAEARKIKVRQEARAAEVAAASQKNGKPKKRKERPELDGVEIKHEALGTSVAQAKMKSLHLEHFEETERISSFQVQASQQSASAYNPLETEGQAKPQALRALDTSTPYDSPSPSKKVRLSPDTSPLSEVANSPDADAGTPAQVSPTKTDVSMDDAEENKVIHKTPAMPQQGFFPDPLAPDPVIYHIRDVTPGMTDDERKEIYSVTGFPIRDLSDLIAGTPPDKDFSNAKPTNQVAANTFLTFVEPYLRPLTEEDMAFLRERGDRTTPFLAVPRGKRHYTEIWAEEDGLNSPKQDPDKLPANQGRGNTDQISEDNMSTDQVSTGPLAARLLSLLRFEHRTLKDENGAGANGDANLFLNGDGNDTMDLDGLTNGDDADKPLPPAASVSDLTGSKTNLFQKLDYLQSDERIKSELRYLNLLGQEENPDFDAHHDDDISERLRLLQGELRRVMILNGARKARLEKIAQERLAYQEYSTIHEDLDSQVQQAYLKRTRTLGKTKKGGPGGGKPKQGQGMHANGIGISRARDIGDNARILMDRRKRWEECIGPVFQNMKHGVPGKDMTLWDPKIIEQLEKEEVEKFEDEAE